MTDKRMAYSGTCSNADCLAITIVAPHDETPDEIAGMIANGPDQWATFPDCYVCDWPIDWNGNDFLPLTVR